MKKGKENIINRAMVLPKGRKTMFLVSLVNPSFLGVSRPFVNNAQRISHKKIKDYTVMKKLF